MTDDARPEVREKRDRDGKVHVELILSSADEIPVKVFKMLSGGPNR